MKKETDRYFHIRTPYFGAWSKYGWQRNDWGLGLNKQRVNRLAEEKKTLIVTYYKNKNEYTVSAEKVKGYPIEDISNSTVKVYIIPVSILNYRKKEEKEYEEFKKYLL